MVSAAPADHIKIELGEPKPFKTKGFEHIKHVCCVWVVPPANIFGIPDFAVQCAF